MWREKAVAALKDGDVLLLENTRFHAGEEENDADAFAKEIAALGDIFVNDAFSAAHRAHATTEGAGASAALRGGAVDAGRTGASVTSALDNPERPLMAVVGGAKVSTKIDLLVNLVKKVDVLVIGGAMANTFLAAQGTPSANRFPNAISSTPRTGFLRRRERRRGPDAAGGRGCGQEFARQRATIAPPASTTSSRTR